MTSVDSWLKADVVEILGGLSLSKGVGQKIL